MRYQYGDARGVHVPSPNSSEWTIEVEESVPDERPYVTGAVVRDVDLDEEALESLIQLQEKLHATMGRKRAKGAIGIHDLTMLKGTAATEGNPTIRYVGVEPDEDRFVPLDSDQEMTPADVLEQHQTGQTYADLVSEYDRYPAIYDSIGLFSFPPVINGRRTEVSTDSRDLFVEMTGTDQWTIDKMLNIVCYALSARGATLEEVTVEYPDHEVVRPDLSMKTKTVAHDRIETILGIGLDPDEVIDLAERSGLKAEKNEDGNLVYEVTIPPYRVDVLHPLDVIDDLGRAYGFNELEPRYPDVGTVGGRHERSRLENAARTQLVGLGFEDLLNFHMISEGENFDRLEIVPGEDVYGAGEPATIKEPYSEGLHHAPDVGHAVAVDGPRAEHPPFVPTKSRRDRLRRRSRRAREHQGRGGTPCRCRPRESRGRLRGRQGPTADPHSQLRCRPRDAADRPPDLHFGSNRSGRHRRRGGRRDRRGPSEGARRARPRGAGIGVRVRPRGAALIGSSREEVEFSRVREAVCGRGPACCTASEAEG